MGTKTETGAGDTRASSVNENDTASAGEDTANMDFTKGKSWRFGAIFPSLMVTTLLSAMEVTVVSTALPTIVHDLTIGSNYIWIVNSFVLTRSVFNSSRSPVRNMPKTTVLPLSPSSFSWLMRGVVDGPCSSALPSSL